MTTTNDRSTYRPNGLGSALDGLDPDLAALIPACNLECMDEELDAGMRYHLAFGQPEAETEEWVVKAIRANPGVWTAKLCRAMHNIPETYQGIAWCGVCEQYCNPRRRRRARKLVSQILLPGYPEGAFQLRPPCSKRGLTWLRHLTDRLRDRGQILKRREFRPDLRQPRGYDLMTCLYPAEEENNDSHY